MHVPCPSASSHVPKLLVSFFSQLRVPQPFHLVSFSHRRQAAFLSRSWNLALHQADSEMHDMECVLTTSLSFLRFLISLAFYREGYHLPPRGHDFYSCRALQNDSGFLSAACTEVSLAALAQLEVIGKKGKIAILDWAHAVTAAAYSTHLDYWLDGPVMAQCNQRMWPEGLREDSAFTFCSLQHIVRSCVVWRTLYISVTAPVQDPVKKKLLFLLW